MATELLIPKDGPPEIDRRAGYSYFDDGLRRVDFVIEYIEEKDDEERTKNSEIRQKYFSNLEQKGLELETCYLIPRRTDYGTFSGAKGDENNEEEKEEKQEESEMDHVVIVKVHAPFPILCRYAERTKMKFPVAMNDIIVSQSVYKSLFLKCSSYVDPFVIRNPQFQEPPNYFVEEFRAENLHECIHAVKDGVVDEDAFFTSGQRSRLVEFVLTRTMYGEDDSHFGYKQLEHDDVIRCVYPLHDGHLRRHQDEEPTNFRQKLEIDWASSGRMFKYQPIHAIADYFGEKVALYFAWLGFLTTFLVPAAIVGVLTFVYGIVYMTDDVETRDVCQDPSPRTANGTYLYYMCPVCARLCPYYLINATCVYAKATRAFDNNATIFFTVFMVIWATLFLEFWKRKQVKLAYQWHTMDFEEVGEQSRPEYKLKSSAIHINPITKKEEIYMPTFEKRLRLFGSYTVVAFFLVIVLTALLGVIIFRSVAFTLLSQLSNTTGITRSKAAIIVSVSASCLNLLCINVLMALYSKIADSLTDWENPRTRTEYEDSFTVKMFWFQFFNTYSYTVYLAFFKSTAITGTPGNEKKLFGKIYLQGCSAQGCFIGVTTQIIIVMIGQQIIGNCREILIPYLKKKWQMYQIRKKQETGEEEEYKEDELPPQWVPDHSCQAVGSHCLFDQYLEIVLQYGWLTIFVAAFPLAPLFALINNLIEIRLDAVNFVRFFRRSLCERAEDIGAWYGILATLTMFATIISAFILAFTSDEIPRLTYIYYFSNNGTLDGYLNFSLSTFNVADFSANVRPTNATIAASGLPQQSTCRYRGFYEPYYPYQLRKAYWVILAARLTFVIVFQLFVFTVTQIVMYVVPDMPESLQLTLRREKYLIEAKKDK